MTIASAASGLVAQAAAKAWELSFSDRGAGFILSNPVVMSGYRPCAGIGALIGPADVIIGWGETKLAAVVEANPITMTDPSLAAESLTPARQAVGDGITDMAAYLDSSNAWAVANRIMAGMVGYQRRVIDLIAANFTTCTTSVSLTGLANTYLALRQCIGKLERNYVAGPYVAILHPKQWDEAARDGLLLTGAISMSPEMQNLMKASGGAYKGTFFGGSLDVYTSAEVDTGGGDYIGGVFGRGFVIWTGGAAPVAPGEVNLLWTPAFKVEAQRIAEYTTSNVITSSHMAANIAQIAGGCKLLSVVA
jgi:hypothetical protein